MPPGPEHRTGEQTAPDADLRGSRALGAYLGEVALGLRGLPAFRRQHFLEELEGHLLDEAEARGITDEAGLEAMLREKESPEDVARELGLGEGGDASHRGESALAAGSLIGLSSGVLLFAQGFRWYLALSFGLVHGLAVGSGLLWMRPRWQWMSAPGRLLLAVLMGGILAIPLGFTKFQFGQDFLWSRLCYGAFTGYLVERHSLRRPLWQAGLEVVGFTGLMVVIEFVVLRRLKVLTLAMAEKELIFNATIALAVLGALAFKRSLAGRWLLRGWGDDEQGRP